MENIFWSIIRRLMHLGRGGKILKQLPQGEPGWGSFEETEFELISLRAQMQKS